MFDKTRSAAAAFVLALIGLATTGAAQGLREVRSQEPWSTTSLGFLIAEPVGQFAEGVGTHPGVGLSINVGGPVGLRMTGSVLVYGHDEEYLYPGYGYGGWDLDIDNLIVTAGLGPQITVGAGPARLYLYGTLGFSYFATISSVGGGWAETTHFDDWTMAREAGAGMQLRLSRHRPIYLDLSARYLRNGRVRYLREGSLVEQPDGSLSMYPVETHANSMVFQIGIAFGMR